MRPPSLGAKPVMGDAWDRFLGVLDTLTGATPRPSHRIAPDNTHSGEPNMTQHVTPQGHEAIVREDWRQDVLHVILRRQITRSTEPGPQYAWATTLHTDQGPVTALTQWVAAHTGDDGDVMPDANAPGIAFRRDDAAAIHAALGEALGYDSTTEVASLQHEVDRLTEAATHLREERDEARTDAMVQGARAMGLEDTLALLREWHADTRARLERAETPPILHTPADTETVQTMAGDHMWTVPAGLPPYSPGRVALPRDVHDARDVIKAVMDQVGPTRLRHLVDDVTTTDPGGVPSPEPSSTPVDQPVEDDYPVGTRLEDDQGDVWTKGADGQWTYPGAPALRLDLEYVTNTYGPLKPAHSEASDTESEEA